MISVRIQPREATKPCKCCRRVLPISEFHRNVRNCKDCARELKRQAVERDKRHAMQIAQQLELWNK